MRQQIRDFIQGLDPKYLECRDWGHNWNPATSSANEVDGEVHCARTCSGCGATVTRVQTFSGDLLYRRMTYPEGYLAEGLGRLDAGDRALMRVQALRLAGVGQ